MKRIDLIHKKLLGYGKSGATATQIADELGLTRANVSSDLNELCRMEIAQKNGTKPVYYRVISTREKHGDTPFDAFLQKNPTLFRCGEQAKAAVLYPPNGMNILLFGETGVGKNLFAEYIYKYAVDMKIFSSGSSFVIFNCADYANNPQLLVSQLFGTKKGAYTGADADCPGLLEKANGGILFLDEIHRLPSEGQEMLFSFIDRGTFRRLGETENERHATVLLICATTEDLESNLLQSFTRRIPMLINIPNLAERTVDERLNIISTCFLNESQQLGLPVEVSVNSIRSLLGYRCHNNIGQLSADIRILCAKAYSDYITGKSNSIRISSYFLPPHIKEGLYVEKTHRQIWNRLVGLNKRFCVFDTNQEEVLFKAEENPDNIYELMECLMRDMEQAGLGEQQMQTEINNMLDQYYKKYRESIDVPEDFSSIANLVGLKIVFTVDKVITYAQKRLGCSFSDNIRYGLAVHLSHAVKRIEQGRRIVNPKLNEIRSKYSDLFAVALGCIQIVEQEFDIVLPLDEAGFLALFFSKDALTATQNVFLKVIVAAHGTAVATGLAATANRLLGCDIATGFDAELDENPSKVYERIKTYLKSQGEVSGVLLLVDMGSLINIADYIETELNIPAKCIPLVSTLHVLEASRKAALGYPLDYIYEETMKVNELLDDKRSEIIEPYDIESKVFALTLCTTGSSAGLIKSILEKQITFNPKQCEVIALNLIGDDNIYSRINSIEKFGRIACIISMFPIKLNVPCFDFSQVLDGSAIAPIQQLIDKELTFARIGVTISNMLTSVNGKTAYRDIRRAIEQMQGNTGIILSPEMLIGIFCHMGSLLDRLKKKENVNAFPYKDKFIQKHPNIVSAVKKECEQLGAIFDVCIPQDEVCYISSFFAKEDLI